jgi:sodium transport system permease protein
MRRGPAPFWVVLKKELSDALRDRRTLATVLVSSVLMGPLVLLAISGLVASLESRAEQREVYVAGLAHAPTLRNYLERQTYTVKEAPADFEARLALDIHRSVVVVPADFRDNWCWRRAGGRRSPTAPTSAPRRARAGSSDCSAASVASGRC